jgi:hypothetical protein
MNLPVADLGELGTCRSAWRFSPLLIGKGVRDQVLTGHHSRTIQASSGLVTHAFARDLDLEEDGMARKTADADVVAEQRDDAEPERKPRRRRKLAMLLAIAGGVFYLMRRSQRRAKIDEGVWHEAPSA